MHKKVNLSMFSFVLISLIFAACSLEADKQQTKTPQKFYTVVYNANGGEGKMEASSFPVNTPVNLPPNIFTRTNHLFIGWTTSEEGIGVEYADKAEIKNLAAANQTIILYAVWGVNLYKVEYNANGGEGQMPPGIFTLNTACTLAANTFTREGYIFAGWSPEAGGEAIYYDGESIPAITSNSGDTITLYAVWGTNIYMVYYEANGGSGPPMAPSVFTLDQDSSLSANTYTHTDQGFVGWAITEEGYTKYTDRAEVKNLAAIAGEKVILYAVWRPYPEITWPTGFMAVYGQTLSDIDLSGASCEISGTFTWTVPDSTVGNAGTQQHSMTFTPQDTGEYAAATHDSEITVSPKPMTITVDFQPILFGSLIPFYSTHPQYGSTIPFQLTVNGLLGNDTVTVILPDYEQALSFNTDIRNDTGKSIELSYHSAMDNQTSPVSAALGISDNDNYTVSGNPTIDFAIIDGLANDRAIPLVQLNILSFNAYANTEDGLRRHYKLMEDIKLSETGNNWTAIGTSAAPFTGSFTGNGYTISNICINTTADYQGMFGYTGVTVNKIGLVNVNISGGNHTGAVAGYSNYYIEECYASGRVNGGNYTGGLAGEVYVMRNCYSTADVSGGSYTGGLTGVGWVYNSYATGNIIGNGENVGGIAGEAIQLSYNCVALNPSVRKTGSSNTVGRAYGDISQGSAAYTYARSDMIVQYNWNGSSGTDKTTLTTGDGESANPSQYNISYWWSYGPTWSPTPYISPWNFSDVWEYGPNSLPILSNVGGEQNHKVTVNINLNMVKIAAGNFTMGSPTDEPGHYANEDPRHSVFLSDFYMSEHPITQMQYEALMWINPSHFHGGIGREPAPLEVQRHRPVEWVSWYDAVEFCNKLSQMDGLEPVYIISGRTPANGYPISDAIVSADWNMNGYRLPTEAQWEYACRARTDTAYNTGASISDNTGWYSTNSSSMTHEVKKKPGNAWGLYDMHGNVQEWCWDWYGNYTNGVQTDPPGPSSGTGRVVRGGSYLDAALLVRSAYRNYFVPSYVDRNIGFRIARP